MAKKEKIQYPNPEFFRCKDEINWKAQWENLKEVGAIAWDMLKATDWKQFGLDRVEDAKADGKRVKEEFEAFMALDAENKKDVILNGERRLGRLYRKGAMATVRREWRGIKDTAYDFYEWARMWGMLLMTFSKDLIPALNSTLYYRWMVSYFCCHGFMDKNIMGLRGSNLRMSHLLIYDVFRYVAENLVLSAKCDKKNGNCEALNQRTVLFDEMTMGQIMAGFPDLYGFPHQLLAVFLVSFLSVLPQITVTVQSFRKTNGPLFVSGFSFDSYIAVWSKAKQSITNTFLYAVIALAIIIVLSLLGAYLIVRRKSFFTNLIDVLLMFPYVIPGAVLGICLIVAFNSGAILLTGSMWIIIISFIIRKLPYTMRSSVGILYQIDNSVEEASISLGVPPMRTFFKTTVHLMLPGVLSGAVLSFVSVINTLSATLLLYTGKTVTIPVAIFNCVNNDAYGQASALSTILTLTTVLCLILFNKISGGKSVVG